MRVVSKCYKFLKKLRNCRLLRKLVTNHPASQTSQHIKMIVLSQLTHKRQPTKSWSQKKKSQMSQSLRTKLFFLRTKSWLKNQVLIPPSQLCTSARRQRWVSVSCSSNICPIRSSQCSGNLRSSRYFSNTTKQIPISRLCLKF